MMRRENTETDQDRDKLGPVKERACSSTYIHTATKTAIKTQQAVQSLVKMSIPNNK